MAKETILLDDVSKVKSFISDISRCRCSARIEAKRYSVDARSIMGLFSLDLSRPVDLILEGDPDDIGLALEIAGAYAA